MYKLISFLLILTAIYGLFSFFRPISTTMTNPTVMSTATPAVTPEVASKATPKKQSDVCPSPSSILHLKNWKLTLPSGAPEKPTEIKQPALSTYSDEQYFATAPDCKSVLFRAEVGGITTKGSSYPRSELREMSYDGTANSDWSTFSGTHTMFIDEAITAVPFKKRHVVAGQIHDADDDVIFIRLEYPKLFISINGKEGPTLDANYELGRRFTIKYVVAHDEISVYYNQNSQAAFSFHRSGTGFYFKAGAYAQSNCEKEDICSADNYAEVRIYKLDVGHISDST